MRILKRYYFYKRNGVYYVQFKDKITGKKFTAKSTGTRSYEEAVAIADEWYYNIDSFFNQKQKADISCSLKAVISQSYFSEREVQSLFNSVLSELFISAAKKNTIPPMSTLPTPIKFIKKNSEEPEIQELLNNIDTLTFKDYLFQYFDKEKSPKLNQLRRLGKPLPRLERYKDVTGMFNKYQKYLSDSRLVDITAAELNTFLGSVKNNGKLADASMGQFRRAIVEVLRFAYSNGLIPFLFTDKITTFSNKNKAKEIFLESELKTIFNPKTDHFGGKHFKLINKLLIETGCRIGEILALQIKDLQKTPCGYELFVGKNYNFKSKILKDTKTSRIDYVPISDSLAQELYQYIDTNPYKNDTAFIFYSKKKNEPLEYSKVRINFNKMVKNLGIKRPNLTLHSYRHTYATLLQDAGYSDLDLMYLTRHDSIEHTKHYSCHESAAKRKKKRDAASLIARLI